MGLAMVAVLALAACGNDDDEDSGDTRPEATAANTMFDASPAAGTPARGGLPQDANTATVAIEDGKLAPDTIEGQVGFQVVLTVQGDGSPHTLEIEGLVAGQQIAANGDTLVQFTVPEGSEGEKTILLDGEDAGTFQAQGPGGITD